MSDLYSSQMAAKKARRKFSKKKSKRRESFSTYLLQQVHLTIGISKAPSWCTSRALNNCLRRVLTQAYPLLE